MVKTKDWRRLKAAGRQHWCIFMVETRDVQCPEVAGSEEKMHGHHQVSMLDAEDHWMAVLLIGQPGEGARYQEVSGSVEKVHGHHQVYVFEVGGSWLAVLPATLWQLGKLLAMHVGGVATITWMLPR